MLVVGVITGVISRLIVDLITKSPWIKNYFVDILDSLAERMAEATLIMSNVLGAPRDMVQAIQSVMLSLLSFLSLPESLNMEVHFGPFILRVSPRVIRSFPFQQNTPHEGKQIARRSSKIYEGTLLKIYSRGHRKEFGDQMACAFEELDRAIRHFTHLGSENPAP